MRVEAGTLVHFSLEPRLNLNQLIERQIALVDQFLLGGLVRLRVGVRALAGVSGLQRGNEGGSRLRGALAHATCSNSAGSSTENGMCSARKRAATRAASSSSVCTPR